jgi:hypothetical protein
MTITAPIVRATHKGHFEEVINIFLIPNESFFIDIIINPVPYPMGLKYIDIFQYFNMLGCSRLRYPELKGEISNTELALHAGCKHSDNSKPGWITERFQNIGHSYYYILQIKLLKSISILL